MELSLEHAGRPAQCRAPLSERFLLDPVRRRAKGSVRPAGDGPAWRHLPPEDRLPTLFSSPVLGSPHRGRDEISAETKITAKRNVFVIIVFPAPYDETPLLSRRWQ